MSEVKVIGIGNDHAAVDLKNEIKAYLEEKGYKVVNYGTDSSESCDYPVYGAKVGNAVASGEHRWKRRDAQAPAEGVSETSRRWRSRSGLTRATGKRFGRLQRCRQLGMSPADCGRIRWYRADSGFWKLAPGAGPAHRIAARSGRKLLVFLYLP